MPFDEEASAQSFREALTQWRAGQQKENKQQDSHAKKPGMVIVQIFIQQSKGISFISTPGNTKAMLKNNKDQFATASQGSFVYILGSQW